MSKTSLNLQEKKIIAIANANTTELATLTITAACSTAGQIEVSFGTEIYRIGVLTTDDTTAKVAIKVMAHFANSTVWTTVRTDNEIVFTRKMGGAVTNMAFDGLTTGVTATAVTSTSAIMVSASTDTPVYLDFSQVTEDNYNAVTIYQRGVNDWNFVCPKAGVYDISCQIATAAHTLEVGKKYTLFVYVGGSAVAVLDQFQSQSTTASSIVTLKGTTMLRLNKSHVVKFVVLSDNVQTVNISCDTILNKCAIIKRETKIEEC